MKGLGVGFRVQSVGCEAQGAGGGDGKFIAFDSSFPTPS